MLLGVDVGGTFTDAVLVGGDDTVFTAKVPSTPGRQADGVLEAVALVLERASAAAGEVSRFAHGMTVATNALLEGRTARTALIATEGFTDVVELARQARPHLYRLCDAPPPPLVESSLRFPAPERMTPQGPLRALTPGDARAVADGVAGSGAVSVAVALLHSYADPRHEVMLGTVLRELMPGAAISLSSDLVGTFREYERTATTVLDAALSPLLAGYLESLRERSLAAGLPEPEVMQSSGGLTDAATAAEHAALTVLSGPAGGAGGARLLADLAGESRTLCFDMGGTSCDVCVIDGGEVAETAEREIAGRPLALPALDIHTVGAGGGSIAWRDAGGALRVGPRSAGAVPGPACYGRGGTEPTVTDANLLLGRLLDDSALPGGIVLDRGAAERAIGHLGADLGLDPIACAAGIVRVAEAEMLGALRVMTVGRGIDPRAFALMPFGGAGPLHAVALARELGIGRVICPRASGVLSALGLAAAPPRRDAARTLMLRGEELDDERLASERRAIVGRAVAALSGETERVRVTHELRYRGQSFELAVEERLGSSEGSVQGLGAQELRREFARAHVARYGYEDAESDVELVNLRASVWGPAPRLAPSAGSATPPERRRALVVFDDGPAEAAVLRGEPAAGTAATGPLVWALPEATLLVPPGWQATVDPHGTIHVRERGTTTRAPAHGGAG